MFATWPTHEHTRPDQLFHSPTHGRLYNVHMQPAQAARADNVDHRSTAQSRPEISTHDRLAFILRVSPASAAHGD